MEYKLNGQNQWIILWTAILKKWKFFPKYKYFNHPQFYFSYINKKTFLLLLLKTGRAVNSCFSKCLLPAVALSSDVNKHFPDTFTSKLKSRWVAGAGPASASTWCVWYVGEIKSLNQWLWGRRFNLLFVLYINRPEPETISKIFQKQCFMLGSFKIFLNSNLDSLGNLKSFKSTGNSKPTFVPKFNLLCYQVNNKKKSELISISALLSASIYYWVKAAQWLIGRKQEKRNKKWKGCLDLW